MKKIIRNEGHDIRQSKTDELNYKSLKLDTVEICGFHSILNKDKNLNHNINEIKTICKSKPHLIISNRPFLRQSAINSQWDWTLSETLHEVSKKQPWDRKKIRVISFNMRQAFAWFSDVKDIQNFIFKQKVEYRKFHEILRGQHKPFFDIETKVENCNNDIIFEYSGFLGQFMMALRRVFTELYQIELDITKEVLVTFSHGWDYCATCDFCKKNGRHFKISWHVILPNYYFATFEQTKYFAREVQKLFDDKYKQLFDMGVYAENKQLRILGCCKDFYLGFKPRTKKILGQIKSGEHIIPLKHNWTFADSFVTNVTNCQLLEVNSFMLENKEFTEQIICENSEIEELSEKISEHIQGLDFTCIHDNKIGRATPGHCQICNKIHEHFGAYIFKDEIGSMFLGCFRSKQYNNNESKHICLKSGGKLKLKLPGRNSKLKYNLPECKAFPRAFKTLCVRSAMGTGKTQETIKLVKDLIANHVNPIANDDLFDDNPHDPYKKGEFRILLISFRVSFTRESEKNYVDIGFEVYDNKKNQHRKGEQTHNSSGKFA